MKKAFAKFASIVYSNPSHIRGDGAIFSFSSDEPDKRREKRKSDFTEHRSTTFTVDSTKKRRISVPQDTLNFPQTSQHAISEKRNASISSDKEAQVCSVSIEINERSQITVPNLSTETPDSMTDLPISKISRKSSNLMKMIPPDVLSHCLLFLPQSNRMSLLCVSKDFLRICNSSIFLKNLELGGAPLSGHGGFILQSDTRESAVERLYPLFRAGNLTACHM